MFLLSLEELQNNRVIVHSWFSRSSKVKFDPRLPLETHPLDRKKLVAFGITNHEPPSFIFRLGIPWCKNWSNLCSTLKIPLKCYLHTDVVSSSAHALTVYNFIYHFNVFSTNSEKVSDKVPVTNTLKIVVILVLSGAFLYMKVQLAILASKLRNINALNVYFKGHRPDHLGEVEKPIERADLAIYLILEDNHFQDCDRTLTTQSGGAHPCHEKAELAVTCFRCFSQRRDKASHVSQILSGDFPSKIANSAHMVFPLTPVGGCKPIHCHLRVYQDSKDLSLDWVKPTNVNFNILIKGFTYAGFLREQFTGRGCKSNSSVGGGYFSRKIQIARKENWPPEQSEILNHLSDHPLE
nr:hypothetical protein Iba_chr05eCG9720 [Ipomoea batatas]